MELEKLTGEVKWFSAKKGYGFIAPDGGDKDVFVHYSGIEMEGYKTLKANDRVEFSLKSHDKGPIAVEVRVLSSPSQDD